MKRRGQSGFSIVSAIFILVVLAALGAFMVTISTTQQISSALDVQGARAYQAARAGVEWGIYKVNSTNSFSPNPALANSRACPASSTSFAFSLNASTLSSFSVTVYCTRVPVDDSPTNNPNNSPAVYSIVAIACNQPSGCPNENPSTISANYIERRVEVSF